MMELAENGNLEFYRRNKNFLEEDEAFVYFLQTLLAIEYLHNREIIHRDIKPENLLFDKDCNIKLCDFGWSDKQTQAMQRQTFCGTLHYMAPEIIRQEEYSFPVDIWALGILLYEMTHGKTPFQNSNRNVLKENVQSSDWDINFMRGLSNSFTDLIKNLLKNKPEDRLQVDEIFYHPWIKEKALKHKANIDALRFQNSTNENRISQSTVVAYYPSPVQDHRETKGNYYFNF